MQSSWRDVFFRTVSDCSLFHCPIAPCQAQAAVEFLVPHVCRCDPDGISLYFFNGSYDKFENISSPEEVMEKFQEYEPGGGTKLSKVRYCAGLDYRLLSHSCNLRHGPLSWSFAANATMFTFTLCLEWHHPAGAG